MVYLLTMKGQLGRQELSKGLTKLTGLLSVTSGKFICKSRMLYNVLILSAHLLAQGGGFIYCRIFQGLDGDLLVTL